MAERPSNFIVQCISDIPVSDIPKILDKVVKLEKEVWPEEIQASREKFESRAEVFPQGFLMISLSNLGLMGVSTAEIINYDPENPPVSWEEITDNGWIKKTHNPSGNALYLESVGAKSGYGVGSELVKQQIELAKKLNLKYLVLGSRIPGYHQYHTEHPDVSIDGYLVLKRNNPNNGKETYDPEVRFYERCGLRVAKVVTNYMEDDPESEDYGAVMVWENKQNT